MNAITTKVLCSGALLLAVFAAGYVLSRAGKPYPTLLFTVHKLAALGALVLLGLAAAQWLRIHPQGAPQAAALAAAAVCFLALIVTGGLISGLQIVPVLVRRVHAVLPYLGVLALGLFVLLSRGGLTAAPR